MSTVPAVSTSIPAAIHLDGLWEFTYTPDMPGGDLSGAVLPSQFAAGMPVPGYWDDHLERLQQARFWGNCRFNPEHRPDRYPMSEDPPDATSPFLLGVGWYRNRVQLPPEAAGTAVLRLGGVRLEAWLWVNGNYVGHHLGHSTAFEWDISGTVRWGESNELILAVSNLRRDRLGTSIRGWAGFSAGVTGSVALHLAGQRRLSSVYVHASSDLAQLSWHVALDGACAGAEHRLAWRVVDPVAERLVDSGSLAATGAVCSWQSDAHSLQPWSDTHPALYRLEVDLLAGETLIDMRSQSFGLRRLSRDGLDLLLNGNPVFLRGATEHAYYAATCTPPLDRASYRADISRLRAIGFNWLRFHTSVPNEAYMDAADELGMMIQVEAPLGFEDPEWRDILQACRVHPSVVIYCCGNEECLDDAMIERLARLAELQKSLVPDALFNPQEALRGVEYCWKQSDFGDRVVREPYMHTPHRLERLKDFSDCFGQYPWGHLSYRCSGASMALLNERLPAYERPLLSHEMGIIGNYLDLDLEHRYVGTRIGSGMFASLREYLEREGLLPRASLYYRNSCAWSRLVRKHAIEMARRCRYITGYDFLGGIDCHWHRIGYPCGVLNEFYELKPGESEADILRYNGESILLCDAGSERNCRAGQSLSVSLFASLFGRRDLDSATLIWAFRRDDGTCESAGTWSVGATARGGPRALGTVTAELPAVSSPVALTLSVRLVGGGYDLGNEWRFWVFPEVFASVPDSLEVVERLENETIERLEAGAAVVLLGAWPFASQPTSFQPACAGRSLGNLATVIADHPLMQALPHEGYCDWQFQPMLEGGQAIQFTDPGLPFEPILEVVSSFKRIRKQAAVFECRVGRGRLLVCSLNLSGSDPGARWFRGHLLRYAAGPAFAPSQAVAAEVLQRLVERGGEQSASLGTDQGFDARAQL